MICRELLAHRGTRAVTVALVTGADAGRSRFAGAQRSTAQPEGSGYVWRGNE